MKTQTFTLIFSLSLLFTQTLLGQVPKSLPMSPIMFEGGTAQTWTDFVQSAKVKKDTYPVDLNHDGQMDEVVYQKSKGGVYTFTVRMKDSLGTFSRVLTEENWGAIFEVYEKDTQLYVIQTITKWGKGNQWARYETFELNVGDAFELNLVNTRFAHRLTSLPNTQSLAKAFKVRQPKYNLRSIPGMDSQHILTSYSVGATGKAIAHHTDRRGRTWWFVVMDQENGCENCPGKGYMGWMDSRSLEELTWDADGNTLATTEN